MKTTRTIGNWYIEKRPYPEPRKYKHLFWVGKKNNSWGNSFFIDHNNRILDLKKNKIPRYVLTAIDDFVKNIVKNEPTININYGSKIKNVQIFDIFVDHNYWRTFKIYKQNTDWCLCESGRTSTCYDYKFIYLRSDTYDELHRYINFHEVSVYKLINLIEKIGKYELLAYEKNKDDARKVFTHYRIKCVKLRNGLCPSEINTLNNYVKELLKSNKL